jgi:uncharacterized membrane protein
MSEVDLRPMTLGEVLDRTFKLYRSNFWLFAGIIALPFLVLFVINIGIASVAPGLRGGAASAVPSPGLLASMIGGGLTFGLLYLFLLGAAQAATVFAVSDLYLGRSTGLRECYKRVGGKAFRVILILILTALIVIVGFLLLIIPGFILLCRTAISVPVSMLEDSKSIRSIERSMELTKGYAGQMFVIFLMVWVLTWLVAVIFQTPFAFLMQAQHTVSFGTLLLQHLSSFVSQVLVGPIATIAFSLMYYNLRVRKEAFDIQHLMASLGPNPSPNAPSAA